MNATHKTLKTNSNMHILVVGLSLFVAINQPVQSAPVCESSGEFGRGDEDFSFQSKISVVGFSASVSYVDLVAAGAFF